MWLEGIFSGNSGNSYFSYQCMAYIVTPVLVSEKNPSNTFQVKAMCIISFVVALHILEHSNLWVDFLDGGV